MTKAAELAKMGEVLTNSQIGGRRNIIINGAMQVAQRGTQTGQGGAEAMSAVDRFKVFGGGSTAGRLTSSQDSDAPVGFANSLKLDCTTADTSIAAGEFLLLEQRIEGQDLQQLAYGSSAAKQSTLSFYVKSNKTGNASVALRQPDASDRLYSAQYTISSANTWERKTLTFNADTTGEFTNDNNLSLRINFWLVAGSQYQGGTFYDGTWGADTDANRVHSSQVNLGDTVGNEWYITGIQLEVGEQATPFEHRSFADELQRCQRYYFALQAPIAANGRYYSGAFQGNYQVHRNFHVQMRTSPTATASHTNVDNTSSMSLNQSKSGGVGLTGNITNTAFQYAMFIDTSTYDAEL